jgi:antitoxin (DNA-binding transcriptional repressor) of toxin-antitoxin stability system
MEVSITKFRRDMFELVNRAMGGSEIWVAYKGRRFKIAPDDTPGSRLDRITPLQVINPESSELNDSSLREEMARAWENDWSSL